VQGSAWYGDYVPTYFGSQFYWFDAEPVYLTQSGDNYDISLIYAGNGGGPGSVGGNIDDGPFRLMDPESAGVANANPVAGADVIVTNLSGNPQRWIDADDNGNFNISNLAYGTYRLWADEPGMTCVPIEFTISPDFPYVFIELVMGDELTGTEALNSSVQIGNVYPNPTANQALIKINGMPKETIILDVMGLDGRLYQREMLSLQNQSIDIDQLPSGIYQLRIRNTSGSVLSVQKLSVIK
jgi:hypothetical protein